MFNSFPEGAAIGRRLQEKGGKAVGGKGLRATTRVAPTAVRRAGAIFAAWSGVFFAGKARVSQAQERNGAKRNGVFALGLLLLGLKNEWWCEMELRVMERSGMERSGMNTTTPQKKGGSKKNGTEQSKKRDRPVSPSEFIYVGFVRRYIDMDLTAKI